MATRDGRAGGVVDSVADRPLPARYYYLGIVAKSVDKGKKTVGLLLLFPSTLEPLAEPAVCCFHFVLEPVGQKTGG
jgi:hypothetical protein